MLLSNNSLSKFPRSRVNIVHYMCVHHLVYCRSNSFVTKHCYHRRLLVEIRSRKSPVGQIKRWAYRLIAFLRLPLLWPDSKWRDWILSSFVSWATKAGIPGITNWYQKGRLVWKPLVSGSAFGGFVVIHVHLTCYPPCVITLYFVHLFRSFLTACIVC